MHLDVSDFVGKNIYRSLFFNPANKIEDEGVTALYVVFKALKLA